MDNCQKGSFKENERNIIIFGVYVSLAPCKNRSVFSSTRRQRESVLVVLGCLSSIFYLKENVIQTLKRYQMKPRLKVDT